ncbi:Na+/H+ antiporter NhaA [Thermodesulfobacteriota bacterium]
MGKFFRRSESVGTTIIQPFQAFASLEAAGGILLLAAVVVAMIWANSQWGHLYDEFWHTPLTLGLGGFTFQKSLHFWINEGLMTIFFLVVGLEIKREVLVGELASFRRAALPAVAAAGGVIVPALIFYLVNQGTPSERGWGIPMATDIAFVLTALTILKSRLPASLAVFLVSLAIVDDVCAVIVIAVFYSKNIFLGYLGAAFLLLGVLILLNILGVRKHLPYLAIGSIVWLCVYESGLHATIAGVLIAMTIPCRSDFDTHRFSENAGQVLDSFSVQKERGYIYELHEENQSVVRALETMCQKVEPPLQRLEHLLHPWTTFAIVPLFALANAGVQLDKNLVIAGITSRESIGIILGLFLGKQLGILGATWVAVKARLADMPPDLEFKHVYGGAILCGIGFTMSIFIAELCLPEQGQLLNIAKIGILIGSLLSGVVGMLVLCLTSRVRREVPISG